MEAASKARVEARETELQTHYDILKEQLTKQQNDELERVNAREVELKLGKELNTKEARYVARSEQQKQIEQIKEWLNDWSLTKGTQSKRYVVIAAYVIGATVTGYLAYWFSTESMSVIRTSAAQLSWWQWLLLSIKSIFPLAAFITIVAAFIRWSSDLACTRFRRHRVRCFDGTGGASWRGGSSRESSSLRLCA